MTTPSPDARPPETDVEVIARLTRDLEDLRSTMLARTSRQRVGFVEYTPLPTPDPDCVFVQGQTLNKAAYPALWQWIADRQPAGFSTTATTLTLPDYRGRSIVGAGAGPGGTYALGETGGSASRALGIGNLPSHDHGGGVTGSSHSHTGSTTSDSHSHSGTTGTDNPSHQHGVHGHTVVGGVAFNPGSGTAPSNPTGSETGNATNGHTHGFGTSSDAHSHTFTTAGSTHGHDIPAQGSGTPVDIRGPYVALNYQIWT